MASISLPKAARVVVVGGGVVGSSVAYNLAKRGWTDIVLLEKSKLTSGTTWHAAGLVGQLRATKIETLLSAEAVKVYSRLEEETGQVCAHMFAHACAPGASYALQQCLRRRQPASSNVAP